jgi:HD-like signal output (HDOD) protein
MSTPSLPSTEDILAAAAEIGALGPGKAALPRILAALCSPETDAADVARVIAQEPGLAARVLRVANSAYYGLAGRVATLERAFVLLGVDSVRGIAAAACLDRAATRALDKSQIELQDLLLHSVATAAAAEALARRSVHRRAASEAFLAGLLHDFGVTVQVRIDRAALDRLVSMVAEGPPEPVRAAEERAGCVGHELCVAVVFEAWKLPANLIAAVRHHHDPAAAPEAARVVSSLVYVANHMAIQCKLSFGLEPVAPYRVDGALEFLGISPETLEEVSHDLPGRVAELRQVMTDAP